MLYRTTVVPAAPFSERKPKIQKRKKAKNSAKVERSAVDEKRGFSWENVSEFDPEHCCIGPCEPFSWSDEDDFDMESFLLSSADEVGHNVPTYLRS